MSKKRKMSKKRLKRSLVIALILGLSACSVQNGSVQESESTAQQESSQTPEEATRLFNEICDDIFVEYFQNDFLAMHYFFEDPEAYGLDPETADMTLLTLLPDEEYDEDTRDYYNELLAIDPSLLSEKDKLHYQELLFKLGTGMDYDADNFDYLYQFWSAGQNTFNDLITLFTSYPIRSIDNVDLLIKVFQQLPALTDEVEEYTKGQIEKGTFMLYGDALGTYLQAILDEKENKPISTYFRSQIDDLDASEEEKEKAMDRIVEAIETYYYPAFERFKEIYDEYSPQAEPIRSLTTFDRGERYYELIVQESSASSEDIDQIEEWVITQFILIEDELSSNTENAQAFNDLYTLSDNFESLDEILAFLKENYSREFPEVGEMEIKVEEMSSLEALENISPAYTVNQPYDSTGPYPVLYNPNYEYSTELNFFVTMAHETIPGHIYLEQYNKEHNNSKIEYVLHTLAFSESWATYASERAVGWLDLDAEDKHNYILLSLLNDCYLMLLDLEANLEQRTYEEMNKDYGIEEDFYAYLVQNPGVYFSYSYGRLKIHEWFVAAQEALGEDFDRIAFNQIILDNANIHWDLIEEQMEAFIGEPIR